jgi:hypothetical protein
MLHRVAPRKVLGGMGVAQLVLGGAYENLISAERCISGNWERLWLLGRNRSGKGIMGGD